MKIVIVGGVAGGATAMARLRRLDENAEIVLFERGKYISFANCGLPYHVGGEIVTNDLYRDHPEARFVPKRRGWAAGGQAEVLAAAM